jgi:membrane-bound lytic murein transglycosylase D
MNMNGLRRSSYIKQGWKLKVPTGKRTYQTRYSAKATKGKGNSQEYVVRKGDSLWKIANRFGTTTNALKSFNHMQTTRLDIGQVIFIP